MLDSNDVGYIIAEMLNVILMASMPVLAVALGVGLVIAFIQALTQIQEMTLTFVPKIVGIFLILIISMPFMFKQLSGFSEMLFDMIANGAF